MFAAATECRRRTVLKSFKQILSVILRKPCAVIAFYISLCYYYITMKNKSVSLFITLFIAIVAFAAVGAITLVKEERYVKNGVKTDAKITNVTVNADSDEDNLRYDVFVEFRVDGVKHKGQLDYYAGGMKKGDTVPVYYMPGNPDDFSYGKANYVLPIISFCSAGVLFLFEIIVITGMIRAAKLKRFKNRKKLVVAKIESFFVNRKSTVLNKHPAKLVCKDESGNVYKTKLLCEVYENFVVGDEINVYVAASGTKNYAIDVKEYSERKQTSSPATV